MVGYPTIATGTPCPDTDHDGMPDVWETSRGLNRNNAADRNTVAASGYTNLEVYLAGTGSGTTPPTATPATPATPASLWRHYPPHRLHLRSGERLHRLRLRSHSLRERL